MVRRGAAPKHSVFPAVRARAGLPPSGHTRCRIKPRAPGRAAGFAGMNRAASLAPLQDVRPNFFTMVETCSTPDGPSSPTDRLLSGTRQCSPWCLLRRFVAESIPFRRAASSRPTEVPAFLARFRPSETRPGAPKNPRTTALDDDEKQDDQTNHVVDHGLVPRRRGRAEHERAEPDRDRPFKAGPEHEHAARAPGSPHRTSPSPTQQRTDPERGRARGQPPARSPGVPSE